MESLVINQSDNSGEHVTVNFIPHNYCIEIEAMCYGASYNKTGFSLGAIGARSLAKRLMSYADECDRITAES